MYMNMQMWHLQEAIFMNAAKCGGSGYESDISRVALGCVYFTTLPAAATAAAHAASSL